MRKDINLIPKKESTISAVTITVIVMLALILLSLLGYFGVYKPNQNRDRLLKEIKNIENQMQDYEEVELEYGKVLGEVDQVKNSLTILQDIQHHRIALSKVIRDLEKSLPKTAVIKTLSMQSNYLGIIGSTPSYKEISQFILQLRQLELVKSVKLNSTTLEPYTDSNEEDEKVIRYTFDITVELTIGDPIQSDVEAGAQMDQRAETQAETKSQEQLQNQQQDQSLDQQEKLQDQQEEQLQDQQEDQSENHMNASVEGGE